MKINECHLLEPFLCEEGEDLITVARKLREIPNRHIFVVDADKKPTGIISVLDMNNRVVAEAKNPKDFSAKDIMSPAHAFDHEVDIERVYNHFITTKHAMEAITKEGRLIGVLTLQEVMHHREEK